MYTMIVVNTAEFRSVQMLMQLLTAETEWTSVDQHITWGEENFRANTIRERE